MYQVHDPTRTRLTLLKTSTVLVVGTEETANQGLMDAGQGLPVRMTLWQGNLKRSQKLKTFLGMGHRWKMRMRSRICSTPSSSSSISRNQSMPLSSSIVTVLYIEQETKVKFLRKRCAWASGRARNSTTVMRAKHIKHKSVRHSLLTWATLTGDDNLHKVGAKRLLICDFDVSARRTCVPWSTTKHSGSPEELVSESGLD